MSMVSVAWPRPTQGALDPRRAAQRDGALQRAAARQDADAGHVRDPGRGPSERVSADCSAIAELSLRTPSSIRSDVTAEKFSRMASPPRPST